MLEYYECESCQLCSAGIIDKFRDMVPNQMFQWTIVIVINQTSHFKSCFKIYIVHVRQFG